MDQTTFLALLDLAFQDYKGLDEAGTMLGMIVVTIHRKGDDMMLQMGSNVAPEVVDYALRDLVKMGQEGHRMHWVPPTARRTV